MYKHLIILTFACSSILMAQSSPSECAEIESNADRLICYDSFFISDQSHINKADESLDASHSINKKNDKVLSFDEKSKLKQGKQKDKSDEKKFGLSFKQLRMSNLIPEKEETKIITSITKATRQITKKIVFRLEIGPVWESESSVPINKSGQFKKGTEVELEVSRMGGFWMINRSNQIRIKVKRVK